jgi:hypothetical protein
LIEALLREAATEVQGHRFSPRFLIGEWREVVDAWQLATWEDYRDVARLGRKTLVVDEAQDVGVAELRFLGSLGASRPDRLFFAGDLGQRIFQQPFSWRSLGVDVCGRAYTLAPPEVPFRKSSRFLLPLGMGTQSTA